METRINVVLIFRQLAAGMMAIPDGAYAKALDDMIHPEVSESQDLYVRQ